MARSASNTPINTGQSFPLEAEIFVDCIGLAQNPIHHIVTVIDTPSFLKHVVGFGCAGVRGGSVCVYIRANIGK
jgi:hypothetical protein